MNPFKGIALFGNKAIIADTKSMEVSAFLLPKEEQRQSQIIGELAQGKKDTLSSECVPLGSRYFKDEPTLAHGFNEELGFIIRQEEGALTTQELSSA